MIRNLINRFEETGSVADLPTKGPRNTVRTELMVKSVRQSVQEHPTTSTRRRSVQLGLAELRFEHF